MRAKKPRAKRIVQYIHDKNPKTCLGLQLGM